MKGEEAEKNDTHPDPLTGGNDTLCNGAVLAEDEQTNIIQYATAKLISCRCPIISFPIALQMAHPYVIGGGGGGGGGEQEFGSL